MKKLIGFSLSILLALAFVTCEKDTRVSNSDVNAYDVVSVQKSAADLSEAKCPPCSEETAWAGYLPYVPGGRGNWATYVAYPGINVQIPIVVGRNLEQIGWCAFKEATGGMVYLEIYLFKAYDWCLQSVSEPVKIQGYDTAPSGNPKPGLFTTYKGTPAVQPGYFYNTEPFEIYNFYGIHLDVGCCE